MRGMADDWLTGQLGRSADEALPVVWHSVTQLYWSAAEIAEVDAILANYGERHPLALVTMEFGVDPVQDKGDPLEPPQDKGPELRTIVWQPGQEPRRHRLGTAHYHGPPVRI